MRVAPFVQLTQDQRAILERQAEDLGLPPHARIRARVVLRAASGAKDIDIALDLGIDSRTVGRWRKRFLTDGIEGIEKRSRYRPRLSPEKTLEILVKTTSENSKDSRRWTLSAMAQATSVSPTSVARVWQRFGLTPRVLRAEQARGPVEAIVGVYLRPPDCAIALQVGRSNPGPEERDPAPASNRLFERSVAAKNSAAMLRCVWKTVEGHVVGDDQPHRFESWLHFLRLIDYAAPADRGIHVLAEGCRVHHHQAVARWMQDHPRMYLEFAAPHRPWFDWVEKRFYSAGKASTIRRDLEGLAVAAAARIGFPPSPDPFVWIARAAEILHRAQRSRKGRDRDS